MRFVLRGLFACIALISLTVSSGCNEARAQSAIAEPACDGVLWERAAGVTLCAVTCTSDLDCSGGERCRILGDEGAPHRSGSAGWRSDGRRSDEPVFADDVQEQLAARHQAAASAETHPVFDDEPVCEGDCGEYTGNLQIKPSVPLALCDPFHDFPGALPSEADDAVATSPAH